MAVKLFGQFLLEKQAVTPEDLTRAIKLQETKNLKFGEMALAMGLVTEADIGRAHDIQMHEDLRLGEVFVKLGILTEEQVQQVVTMQNNSHLYIGEALVQVGALSAADLYCYLEEFRLDQAPYLTTRIMVPAGVPNPDLVETVADLTYKMFTRVVGLTFRQGQAQVINLLDRCDVTVALQFNGDFRARYLLSVSRDVQAMIARAILREQEVDRLEQVLLDDAVMEFVNIICGNIAAKAGQLGKNLTISTPQLLNLGGVSLQVPQGQTGLLFPIYVVDYPRVNMAIFVG